MFLIKKLLGKSIVLTSIVLCSSLLMTKVTFAQLETDKGVNVDIARKYYSVDSLKKIVKEIHNSGGDYIQLHISDNESYGIASNYIYQGSTQTNQEYLTKAEVRELITYSNALDVMVVPDFDVPAHSKAWLNRLAVKDPSTATAIRSDFDEGTLDYFGNDKTVQSVKEMTTEIMTMFDQPKYHGNQKFVIGGDEVSGSSRHQKYFIEFMNKVASHVKSKGYKPQMWNDSLNKDGLSTLNSNVEILYWKQNSHDGEGLTAQQFIDAERTIYNYNHFTLSFLPSKNYNNDTIVNQIKYIQNKYQINTFSQIDNPYAEVNEQSVKGSALTFWGENATDMTESEVLAQELPLIKAYLEK